MHHRIVTSGLLALLAGPVFAGQLNGTIRSDDLPLTNALVTIDCSGEIASGTTDENGRYSIYVATAGSCTLTVNGVSATVFSSNQPTRHDFVLADSTLIKQ